MILLFKMQFEVVLILYALFFAGLTKKSHATVRATKLQCYICDDCSEVNDDYLGYCTPDVITTTNNLPSTSQLPTETTISTIQTQPTPSTASTTTISITTSTESTIPTEIPETPSTTATDTTTETTTETTTSTTTPDSRLFFKPVYKITLDCDTAYGCYSINIQDGNTSKTKRGCIEIPVDKDGCEAVRELHKPPSQDYNDQCSVCLMDACNSGGTKPSLAIGMLLTFFLTKILIN